jgi:hypothetical protein
VTEIDEIQALFLPVHISLYDGIMKRFTSRTNVFGGILVNDDPDGERALVDLLKAYQKGSGRKTIFTEIRNMSPIDNYKSILNHQGFAYEDQLNFIIDLTPSPDEVLNKIDKSARRNIQRGWNKGEVYIKSVEDHAGILESYELLQKSYFYAQVPLSDVSLFTAAFDYLMPRKMIKIRNAMVGITPIATSIELFYKDLIFAWYKGMDREYSPYNAQDLLMAEILMSGSKNGYC